MKGGFPPPFPRAGQPVLLGKYAALRYSCPDPEPRVQGRHSHNKSDCRDSKRPAGRTHEPLSVLKRDKPASSKACLVVYIATVYYLTFLGGEIKSKKILVPSAS
ncbi:MAG TPA: hypothetical protein VFC84_13565, partial [Desulfosporosinus sp.]|nr:hypothetical protein [Desulfosporosinus sp.]